MCPSNPPVFKIDYLTVTFHNKGEKDQNPTRLFFYDVIQDLESVIKKKKGNRLSSDILLSRSTSH